MSDRCSLEYNRNRVKIEALEDYATDLAKVISVVQIPIKSLDNISYKAVDTTDKLLRELFGQKSGKVDLSLKPDESKKTAYKVMDRIVSDLYRSMENPREVMETVNKTSRVYKMLQYKSMLSKVDVALERLWFGINKAIGNTPESMETTDVFGVRMNKYEQFEPSRKAFRLLNEIEEYTNKNVAKFASNARNLVANTAKDTALIEAGIDTADKVSQMFLFFDEGRQRQLLKEYNVSTRKAGLIEFATRRGFLNVTEENADRVLSVFDAMQGMFNTMNYGLDDVSGMTNKEILAKAKEGTIVSFIRDLKAKINEMHTLMIEAKVDAVDMEQFNRVKKSIDDFMPRKNYVPFVGDDNDSMYTIFGKIDENDTVSLSSWLKHRRGIIDDSTMNKGNFLDSLTMNLAATSVMAKELGNKFFSTYLRKAVDDNYEWFEGSPERRTVKVAIEQGINISEKCAKSSRENNMSPIRAVSSLIGSSILALPGSAIKNVVSGNLNLFWRLGNEVSGKDFRTSLDSKEYLAIQVDEYVNKFLKSTGIASEYTINRADSALKMENLGDKFRDMVMKTADYMGDGIFVGKMFDLYKRTLTIKGTEDILRDKMGSLLYNRLKDELAMKGILTPSKEQVDSHIRMNVDDAFYDINNALGSYHTLNKPFSTRALGETAETTVGMLYAMASNLAYMFRHAGFVTTQNFMHSTADMVISEKNPYSTAKDKVVDITRSGSIIGGLIVAMYEILKRTVFSKDESIPKIASTFTSAIDPLEEMDIIPKMMIYNYMRMFNDEPISDKDYALLKDEALSYTFGILSSVKGNTPSGKFTVNFEQSRRQSEWYVHQMANMPRALNALLDMKTSEEVGYKAIQEIRTQAREKSDSIRDFTALDPLYLVSKVLDGALVKTPNDPVAAWKYRGELFTNTVATAFSFKFWIENELKPTDYDFDDEFTKNAYKRYSSRLSNRRLPQTPVRQKDADYILKYGTGKSRNVVPIQQGE